MMDKEKSQPTPSPEVQPTQPSPVQSPSTPPFSSLCCSKTLLIPLVIAVLVIVLGVGYLVGGAKVLSPKAPPVVAPQITPYPTPTPDLYTESSRSATADWKTYENKDFGFTLRYPENWIVGDFSTEPDPTIYFVPTKTNITFNPFENTTKVVVAPHGYGSEPPSGRILSDGTPFAKFLTINTTLSSWRTAGFVYGSVEVKNLSTSCERDGVVIKSGCDYYGSDRFVYHGTVDTSTWKIIDQILSTFKFAD